MLRPFAVAVLVLLATLWGCGDLGESMEMSRAVERELRDTHGLDADIGFKISNGRLQTVSVTFRGDDVHDESVGTLVDEIEPVVLRHFGRRPQALVVSVVVTD